MKETYCKIKELWEESTWELYRLDKEDLLLSPKIILESFYKDLPTNLLIQGNNIFRLTSNQRENKA